MALEVHDVGKAEELFSKLFGLSFTRTVTGSPEVVAEPNPIEGVETVPDPNPLPLPSVLSFDPTGLFELVQTGDGQPTDRMRSIHFKVTDIEAAAAEMQANGIRVVSSWLVGEMKEVLFHPDDLFGMRLGLVEYTGPSLVESMLS
jgi:predicted enzyme related to lactoylglutathione lyase